MNRKQRKLADRCQHPSYTLPLPNLRRCRRKKCNAAQAKRAGPIKDGSRETTAWFPWRSTGHLAMQDLGTEERARIARTQMSNRKRRKRVKV